MPQTVYTDAAVQGFVRRHCAVTLGIELAEIRLSQRFYDDLGMDSLDSVQLVMDLEKAYDISMPDAEIYKFFRKQDGPTLQDMVAYVSRKLSEAGKHV